MSYRISSLLVLLAILFIPKSWAFPDDPPRGWEVLKAKHFMIYYESDVSDSFIRDVENSAENYYDEITEELGFRRSNYWTWDNRAKIIIFKDASSYVQQTGQPEWSGGVAFVNRKEIYSYNWADGFIDNLLAHEMTHLIFREFVQVNTATPTWFDEGIAVYQERGNKEEYEKLIKQMADSNALIPFSTFWNIGPNQMNMPGVFYAQAASMAKFLLHQYNSDYFVKFSDKLRDGDDFNETLFSVYGFKDIEDFDQSWKSYIASETSE